ncbi:hypothetical protein [Actinoplanes sp. NPDC051851]|uniref:hypothetical protein n=1 Tax=Actinoplanes sp. NPDC051851 TaxID=3154753 RepID=UPI0034406406
MRRAVCFLTTLLALCLAGCGDDAPAAAPTPSPSATTADDSLSARDQLAGLAAIAQDRRYTALYSWDVGNGTPRNVVVTVATDGTWRVDIPQGAQGGTTGVTIVRVATGLYQCTLSSATDPITPTCIKVAEKSDKVPAKYDPRVQRLFRQWLSVFTDRDAALAVSAVQPLAGAQGGTCYSVDSNTAGLDAPADPGVYCFAADGLLTSARVAFGVLTLAGQAVAPATVTLPGPEVGGVPMGMTAVQPTASAF